MPSAPRELPILIVPMIPVDPPFNPGLGTLSRLPPELRLCIYDWIPPYKGKHLRTWGPRSGKNTLAILRASRKLYEEVSHHLYHDIHVSFGIWPTVGDYWATARIPELYRWHWAFRRPESAIRRGFGKFPYHITNVEIEVHAPDPNDSEQLVSLWQKVNHLADLLEKASSVKKITFIYKPTEQHNWVLNAQSTTSVDLLKWKFPRWEGGLLKFGLERGLHDHEAVLLPLCRLVNADAIQLLPAWKFSDDGVSSSDAPLHRFVSLCLSKTLRCNLSPERRIMTDERISLLLRFSMEINARYEFALLNSLGMSRTTWRFKRKFLPWEGFRKLQGRRDEAIEQKYGKTAMWTWPTFTLDE